jgi:carbamoyl-phosphate synthase large subunit
MITAGDVALVVNTPFGSTPNGKPRLDGYEIRTAAVLRYVPCITTIQGLAAGVQGIEALIRGELSVTSLQEHHAALAAATKPAVSA